MRDKKVDVGITYHEQAESIAIKAGIAEGCPTSGETNSTPCAAFRDHFYLVGPRDNKPGLREGDAVVEMFVTLYNAAEKGLARFLSRFDKSATNIKDSELWIRIGQVPWATNYSKWYHQYMAYPQEALKAAVALEEFTITDRGTYLTLREADEALAEKTRIYKSGDENDAQELLNPANMIITANSARKERARQFVEWVQGSEGQSVIDCFAKGKYCLYKSAIPSEYSEPRCPCIWELPEQQSYPTSSLEQSYLGPKT
ncbi:uncharacterized protein LDX57_002538 [Aspergillus melleus]|uniref:uncharacterized protein n=1 Tax=Aspergillus melleus TaxID=138277 RepID=UPI001E8DEAFF|nr:uncharacterized protein LDX57_002538 [Aspergillus melleus]KAH8424795.1 hypothetical protein LDX57_002538 [Aspergillus melleus]